MNFFSVFSLLFIVAMTLAGVVTTITPKEYHLFKDLPAIFLVLGGTLGAAACTVQINRIGKLIRAFFMRMVLGKRFDYKHVIIDLMKIAEAYRGGASFADLKKISKDHFINEALSLQEDGIVKDEEYMELLEERVHNMFNEYNDEATRFKNLGKYPPAFGLMGTVLGMIALLSNLGGADAMKKIGPAMGTCLIATFFGIVTANVFILPVGDSMTESAKEIKLKNLIIIEGIKLILAKKNPIFVAEKLNSFLLPSERLDWKKVSNPAKA